MAQMVNGLYVPAGKDITERGGYIPDPNVSGQRFEPDGKGGGTLYLLRRRFRKGFRKPIEEWIAVPKRNLSAKSEHRYANAG